MAKSKIILFGSEIPEYIECPRCHKPNSCKFDGLCHKTPCPECRETPEYIEKKKKDDALYDNVKGINDAYAVARPTAVYTYKGRNITINNKGDVIANAPYKPLAPGKTDWKI